MTCFFAFCLQLGKEYVGKHSNLYLPELTPRDIKAIHEVRNEQSERRKSTLEIENVLHNGLKPDHKIRCHSITESRKRPEYKPGTTSCSH